MRYRIERQGHENDNQRDGSERAAEKMAAASALGSAAVGTMRRARGIQRSFISVLVRYDREEADAESGSYRSRWRQAR